MMTSCIGQVHITYAYIVISTSPKFAFRMSSQDAFALLAVPFLFQTPNEQQQRMNEATGFYWILFSRILLGTLYLLHPVTKSDSLEAYYDFFMNIVYKMG